MHSADPACRLVDVGGDSVAADYAIWHLGTRYVLRRGLLAEAHARGVRAIRAEVLQRPTGANGARAICRAAVTTARGTFTALGEAHPGSAARPDPATLLRLAWDRATSRALCEALNLRLVPVADLPDALPEGAEPLRAGAEPAPARPPTGPDDRPRNIGEAAAWARRQEPASGGPTSSGG